MDITEKIEQLLTEKYTTDEAFADCFTVEVEMKPGNKLYVFADSDSGMTFEKCQKLSRYLEGHLDTQGWLGDSYLLEVSSPGISRPLKFPRQYKRNVGRTLAVITHDKTEHLGTLQSADDERIVLAFTVKEKVDKKKVERAVEVPLAYGDIDKAIVKLAF